MKGFVQMQAFYYFLITERGFKPNSMEIVNIILHPVFTLAVGDGYIRSNSTDGVMAEIKKGHNWEKPKRYALTEEEQVALLLQGMQNEELRKVAMAQVK